MSKSEVRSTLREEAQKQETPNMKRMWALAFTQKALAAAACVLSVVSVMVSFVPFIAIYYIIRELAVYMSDAAVLNSTYVIRLGWLAGGSAVGAIALNFAALMCSHMAAFRTLYQLKLRFTTHLASLPMGFHTQNSTGKVRKIVDENIEKIEGFLTICAAAPDGADGVDDILGRQRKARRDDRLPSFTAADFVAGLLKCRTRRRKNRAANPASVLKLGICGVDYGIRLYLGNISANQLKRHIDNRPLRSFALS